METVKLPIERECIQEYLLSIEVATVLPPETFICFTLKILSIVYC